MTFLKKIFILITVSLSILGLFIFTNNHVFIFNELSNMTPQNQNGNILIFGLLFGFIILFNKHINFVNLIYHFLLFFIILMASYGLKSISSSLFQYESIFFYTFFIVVFIYYLSQYRLINYKHKKNISYLTITLLLFTTLFSIQALLITSSIIITLLTLKNKWTDNEKDRFYDILN